MFTVIDNALHLNGSPVTDLFGDKAMTVTRAQNGNFGFSFGQEFYPRNDSSVDTAENARRRSAAVVARLRIAAKLVESFVAAGAEPYRDFVVRDSYRDKSGNYRPTLQIWVNLNDRSAAQKTESASQTQSDESLVMAAMEIDTDAVVEIVGNTEGTLSMMQRVRLKQMIAKGAVAPESRTQEATVDSDTGAPLD